MFFMVSRISEIVNCTNFRNSVLKPDDVSRSCQYNATTRVEISPDFKSPVTKSVQFTTILIISVRKKVSHKAYAIQLYNPLLDVFR